MMSDRYVDYRLYYLRNGVKAGELKVIGDFTVRMVQSAEIKSCLSVSFAKDSLFDPLFDHLRPTMFLNGIEYPLGEFVVGTETEQYKNGTSVVEIEGYDQSMILSQRTLEKRLSIAAGKRYIDTIQSFLVESGINRVLADSSNATIQTDREDWEIGTPYLQIVNDLLAEISFNEVWFDADGNARLSKYKFPSADNIVRTYKVDKNSVISEPCTVSTDIFGKYNVFRYEMTNPDYEEPLVAVSVNDDPSSPLSTIKRGRIPAPIIRVDNVATLEDLQIMADRAKFESMIASENVEFTTANVPGCYTGEIIAINHPAMQGIYTETEIEMELSAYGESKHKAKKILYL